MAKPGCHPCRRLSLIAAGAVSQFILVTIMLSTEVNGIGLGGFGKLTNSVARSVGRVPSAVMDGGQYATHKLAGAVGSVVQPVKPLKRMVDATGGTVSKMMGTTSRLLGRPKHQLQDVMFLYDRQLSHLGKSTMYQEAVKMMLGHVLTNVVLYRDEMADEPGDVNDLPVLSGVVDKLEQARAPSEDIEIIILLLGCNGKRDIPNNLVPKVLGTLKDLNGIFKSSGPIDELRWIAEHLDGFYQLPHYEMTDYKMSTKYSKCTALFPPITVPPKINKK